MKVLNSQMESNNERGKHGCYKWVFNCSRKNKFS